MKACLALLLLAVAPLYAEPAKKKPVSTKPKSSAVETTKKDPAKKPTKPTPEKTTTPASPSSGKTDAPAASGKESVTEGKEAGKKSPHGQPAVIATSDLIDFDTLPSDRKKLIEGAITVARDSPWLPYKFGGSSPADGGFDCSGAMYFVMNKAGLKPPRTSSDQYLWVKESSRLHEIPDTIVTMEHASLAELKPGDLLFWSGTYAPSDGRTTNITHVAIYLGREKKDKRPVMINATDGRSYRGRQANGYGVYDFYLPKEGSRAKFAGYGTPPGIAEVKVDAP